MSVHEPKPHATALAVAEALVHYRECRGLSRDGLARLVELNGYPLTAERLTAIEEASLAASVDDLVSLSHALEISPLRLLANVNGGRQPGEPAATSLPNDVSQAELLAWLQDSTALDLETRAHWNRELVLDVAIRSTFLDDQLEAARTELAELGELALREADAPQVVALRDRIQKLDAEAHDTELALVHADRRADDLEHALEVQRQAEMDEHDPYR